LHIQSQECERAVEEGVRTFSSMTLDLASALPVANEDLEQGLARARGAALLKFRDVAMGNEATKNEHEQELLATIEESVGRLKKENQAVAVRKNEAWLQERWEKKVEEPLRKYRQMFDSDELLYEECRDAETELKQNIEELEAAYWQESIGSKEAYEEPFERLIKKRKNAALQEVANWKTSIATAGEKAREERARLAAQSNALTKKAKLQAEEAAKKKPGGARGKAGQGNKGKADNMQSCGKAPACCTMQ